MATSRRRRRRVRHRDQAPDDVPTPRPRNGWVFGGVIGLAVLAGLAMAWSAPPIDRVPLLLFEVVIVGLGLILYGAMTAVEKEAVAVDDALYYRRPGGWLRRPLVSKSVFLAVYLLIIVVGIGRAMIQPKHTWPALLWILAGVAVDGLGIGLLWLLD